MESINGTECPKCESNDVPVRFSSHTYDGMRIRQRWCNDCGEKFSTAEIVLPGHSFHSLSYMNRGKPKGSGPYQIEAQPDTISVHHLKSGEFMVRIQQGARPGRPMCRRGLHVLDPGADKPRQCRLCRNASTSRYVQRKREEARVGRDTTL